MKRAWPGNEGMKGALLAQGPWKMCFKVDRNGAYRAPSLLIELSYFTVNHRSLLGTSYEHEKTTQLPLPPNAAQDHPHASPRAF